MNLAAVALRNLSRNRRRTVLSLAIIAAGAIALLLTSGFIAFSFQGLESALIHGGLGHLEIVTRASAEQGIAHIDRPVTDGIGRWETVRDKVESTPGVRAAMATVHLTGVLSAGERSTGFVGVGTEPDRELTMDFETKLRAGELLSPDEPLAGEDGVLVALGLAQTLGVGVGDVVTALVVTPSGMLNAWDLTVVGLYTTGIQDLDGRFLKVHLATAQRLLETQRVSSLVVLLDRPELASSLLTELSLVSPGLVAIDWKSRAPFYEQIQNLYASIFWFLGSIVLVLVVLAVSNTLMMTVMERFREIGTLRAIGTSRRQIATIVLWEAVWLGLIGALAGDAIGSVMIKVINSFQLQMPPPPGAVDAIDLQLTVVPEVLASNVVMMLVVLLAAACYPTLRATRMNIVDALRHV